MGSVEPDFEWVRRCGALTASREDAGLADPIEIGARAAAHLIAVSRALTASRAMGEPPGRDDPLSGPALELASALAAAGPSALSADLPAGSLAPAYRTALEHAAHAVHHCRLVQHARARCWFSTVGPAADLCGRVLVVAHDLRARRPLPDTRS